jgi:isoaspartyl peptidase/L-asparaginase-like protein (Ntn-hydrolase superfamily)
MECTPHVLLVGQNAVRFARSQGFLEAELLTEASRQRWEEWRRTISGAEVAHFDLGPKEGMQREVRKEGLSRPGLTPEDHDTIGLCALDAHGDLAVGCTTSGMAWKTPGRVGDSPILGSGLYVDNAVGAAAATGHGDEIMKACLCYRVVMLMEQGQEPQEACVSALRYLILKRPPEEHNYYGAGLIALRKDGQYGAAATRSGFRAPDRRWQWAVATSLETALHEGIYVTPDAVLSQLD